MVQWAFAPLLDQIDAADLTDAVITLDALHAPKAMLATSSSNVTPTTCCQ